MVWDYLGLFFWMACTLILLQCLGPGSGSSILDLLASCVIGQCVSGSSRYGSVVVDIVVYIWIKCDRSLCHGSNGIFPVGCQSIIHIRFGCGSREGCVIICFVRF